MYCQIQHDGATFEVIHKATCEDGKRFRLPYWLEEPEIPDCCGKPMFFVGQIDDGEICEESPADAEYWWGDLVNFYVFTCSQCLECKAIGQQY